MAVASSLSRTDTKATQNRIQTRRLPHLMRSKSSAVRMRPHSSGCSASAGAAAAASTTAVLASVSCFFSVFRLQHRSTKFQVP